MTTMKNILAGYAGIKLTPKAWLFALLDDARILRKMGKSHEARMVECLAREYAGRIIGGGG